MTTETLCARVLQRSKNSGDLQAGQLCRVEMPTASTGAVSQPSTAASKGEDAALGITAFKSAQNRPWYLQ